MNEQIAFYVLGSTIIISAILTITAYKPAHSLFFLMINTVSLAAVYGLQKAYFAATVQIIVYAMAIFLLFRWILLHLNLDSKLLTPIEREKPQYFLIAFISSIFSFFIYILKTYNQNNRTMIRSHGGKEEGFLVLAKNLYTNFFWQLQFSIIFIFLCFVTWSIIGRKISAITTGEKEEK